MPSLYPSTWSPIPPSGLPANSSHLDAWILTGTNTKNYFTNESVPFIHPRTWIQFNAESLLLNSDGTKMFIATNSTKGYRYSKRSDGWIRPFDVSTSHVYDVNATTIGEPIHPKQEGNVFYAAWSPS
jgi:hypothetical protein